MLGLQPRITHSLSAKLITAFLIITTILAWMLWVSLDISFQHQFSDTIQPYFSKYLISLQEQVGFPPDLATAKTITQKMPVDIIIEAPHYNWSSTGNFIEKPYLDVKIQRLGESGVISEAGFYKGNFILRTFNQGYITSFIVTEQLNKTPRMQEIAIILLITVLLIVVLYAITFFLFKPVKLIERGIKRIGDGEVNFRLAIDRQDELGTLANSINQMADNIEQMLEAKRQLLLAISHELRTPITRAKIAALMLPDTTGKDSVIEDMTEMETLIQELLESERLKGHHAPLEYLTVNLNDLIYQIQGRFFADSPLTLELDEYLPSITVDAKRMSLAIKNIIKNALTARKHPDDEVIIKTQHREQQLAVIITDHGIGIKSEHLAHLTEPFYRTDESRQRLTGGFGIGLYLIKAIIEAHGGTLTIDSEFGRGTSVTLLLPL